jgi:PIN like domain
VRFFLDNTMSPALARAIAELERNSDQHEVVHLREKFKANTTDVEWIPALGAEREWVIISGDLHIARNKAERQAWMDSKLTAFFLKPAWEDQRFWLFSWRFVKWWPLIVDPAGMIKQREGFYVPIRGERFEKVER